MAFLLLSEVDLSNRWADLPDIDVNFVSVI